jgi:hypothetical protein
VQWPGPGWVAGRAPCETSRTCRVCRYAPYRPAGLALACSG